MAADQNSATSRTSLQSIASRARAPEVPLGAHRRERPRTSLCKAGLNDRGRRCSHAARCPHR